MTIFPHKRDTGKSNSLESFLHHTSSVCQSLFRNIGFLCSRVPYGECNLRWHSSYALGKIGRPHPSRGSTFPMHHLSYIPISLEIRQNQPHPRNPIKNSFRVLGNAPRSFVQKKLSSADFGSNTSLAGTFRPLKVGQKLRHPCWEPCETASPWCKKPHQG